MSQPHSTVSAQASADRLAAVAREEYAHIFRFCLALAGNPDEAQDLAQQAFTALAKHHARVQDWSKIRSWLFTTARRVFLKQEAKMARRREFPLDEAGENFFAEAAPDFGIQLDGQSAVAALQELETPMREVLALYYLEDFSYEEIAAQLEIPIGTVMSRLHRGKKQLAAILNHKDNHATPRADRNP